MNLEHIKETIIQFRRHLHMHPELSTKEHHTQQTIITALKEYQIPYEITAETGVIGYINKGKDGGCIALRADIDALPIEEKNDVSYKSQNNGVMHACGHDAHTAILLGVGMILEGMKDQLNGSVKLIFQPDEEVSGGARRVVQEGLLDDVNYILGLHVMPYLEVGEIEVKEGPFNAETGTVHIEVKGQGAHAAYPDQGVDSIVVMAHVINELQTIFTRNISPLEQSVLSFGTIHGGSKSNIIADRVTIEGTLRTLDKDLRKRIIARIKDVCTGVGISHNATITPTFHVGYPPLVNDPKLVQLITANAEEMESITRVLWKEHPSLGGEDFGYYQEKANGVFFHLGCGNKSLGITSNLHTDTFDIDEDCLSIGVELQVRNVLSLLNGDD
jgi:amidohydrolase